MADKGNLDDDYEETKTAADAFFDDHVAEDAPANDLLEVPCMCALVYVRMRVLRTCVYGYR